MLVKYGRELESYVVNSLDQITNERDCIKLLHQYINSPNDRRLCCLYGLRRTGKTIIALQEIREIADYENTLYIVCDPEDTIIALREKIDEFLRNKTSKCAIFIDEITVISNFIAAAACLVNSYSMIGTKVVILGTDSLAFWIAKNDSLYDRVHLIHTTYISYKEYNRVLGKDLDDYLKHGGTLSPYTFDSPFEAEYYTQTAIIDNIKNTLQQWNNGLNIASRILSGGIDNDIEFKSMINKVIEFPCHGFLAEIINNIFDSRDIKTMTDPVS